MQKNDSSNKICGFIDKDAEIIGEIKFKESFRVDGKFCGKIQKGGTLIVGETGEIDAEVEAKIIHVNGKANGVLKALEKIEIFQKGRVTGTIISPKLIIEEGAIFQGTCQMTQAHPLERKEKSDSEK